MLSVFIHMVLVFIIVNTVAAVVVVLIRTTCPLFALSTTTAVAIAVESLDGIDCIGTSDFVEHGA